MSTIKSSTEHLTLNADGSGKDIKFQANGVEKASISSTGAFTSTSIDATKLSGALPAIDGSALTGGPSGSVISGAMLERKYSNTHLSTTSTTFVDSGIWGSYTPVKNSSETRLKVTAHFSFQQDQGNLGYLTCGMDTANSTTYATATSMDTSAYGHRTAITDLSYHATWDFVQTTSGRVESIVPSGITSYTAGTTYYFRIYAKTSAGIYYFGHANSQIALSIEEIML